MQIHIRLITKTWKWNNVFICMKTEHWHVGSIIKFIHKYAGSKCRGEIYKHLSTYNIMSRCRGYFCISFAKDNDMMGFIKV